MTGDWRMERAELGRADILLCRYLRVPVCSWGAIADKGNNTGGFCHISDCIRSAFDAVGLLQSVILVTVLCVSVSITPRPKFRPFRKLPSHKSMPSLPHQLSPIPSGGVETNSTPLYVSSACPTRSTPQFPQLACGFISSLTHP